MVIDTRASMTAATVRFIWRSSQTRSGGLRPRGPPFAVARGAPRSPLRSGGRARGAPNQLFPTLNVRPPRYSAGLRAEYRPAGATAAATPTASILMVGTAEVCLLVNTLAYPRAAALLFLDAAE